MAEQRPGGEATEPPSEKKLRDARRRGDVAKSREVVSAVVLVAAAGVLAHGWPDVVGRLRGYLGEAFVHAPDPRTSPVSALHAGFEILLWVTAPMLGAALVAALVANYAQVGGLLALEPLKPKLERLDPVRNAKNILGKRALLELAKALLKVAGIGYLAGYTIWEHAPQIVGSFGAAPERVLAVVAGCLATMSVRLIGLVGALAAADLVYQRFSHLRKLRMSKYEVKREQQEQEGDPQHKAERQRLHREIIDHQMLESVAEADCVIINPVHIAVALKYDGESMEAPKVVARGRRLMAAKIRQLARRHGVPIVRNVPLARALVDLELDDEIPAELYEAVAEVLRFVYRLEQSRVGDR